MSDRPDPAKPYAIATLYLLAGLVFWMMDEEFSGERGRIHSRTLAVAAVVVGAAHCWIAARGQWRDRRRRLREERGLCPHCGYDMQCASGRCPECGQEVA